MILACDGTKHQAEKVAFISEDTNVNFLPGCIAKADTGKLLPCLGLYPEPGSPRKVTFVVCFECLVNDSLINLIEEATAYLDSHSVKLAIACPGTFTSRRPGSAYKKAASRIFKLGRKKSIFVFTFNSVCPPVWTKYRRHYKSVKSGLAKIRMK